MSTSDLDRRPRETVQDNGSRSARKERGADRATWLRLGCAVVVIGLAVLLGSTVGPLWLNILNLGLIAAVAAVGLDLVLGHTGLVSVGNAAFIAIGAFTVALITRWQDDFPMLLALVAAGAVCAVVGMVVSLPSLRISGLYFGIATLGFQFAALWGLQEIQTGVVGDAGFIVPPADLFGKQLLVDKDWYLTLLVFLLVVLAFYRTLIRRKPGRALHSIRERPTLAAMSGVVVWKYKVASFGASSFIVGVAGGLTAYYIGSVSYENYDINLGIQYLAIVIVGGLGSTYGAVIGAIFITALPQLVQQARDGLNLTDAISSTQIYLAQGAIVGAIVVVVIVCEPRGLIGLGQRAVRLAVVLSRGSRPGRKASEATA